MLTITSMQQKYEEKTIEVRPESQVGAVISQRDSMAAQLLVLCRGHKGQQT